MPWSCRGEVGRSSLRSGGGFSRPCASSSHIAGSRGPGIVSANAPQVRCRTAARTIVSASPPAAAGVSSDVLSVAWGAMSAMLVVTLSAPVSLDRHAGRSSAHGNRVANPDAGMASFVSAAPKKESVRSRCSARRVLFIYGAQPPILPAVPTARVAGWGTTVRQQTGPPVNAGPGRPAPNPRAVASRTARPRCRSTGHGITVRWPDQTAGIPGTPGGEP